MLLVHKTVAYVPISLDLDALSPVKFKVPISVQCKGRHHVYFAAQTRHVCMFLSWKQAYTPYYIDQYVCPTPSPLRWVNILCDCDACTTVY